MKAMFFQIESGNGLNKLYDVFDEKSIKELEEKLDFIPNYTEKDTLEGRKADIAAVEYVFSTWGAPEFTEDEIKTYFPNLKAYFYGAGSVQYFAKPFLNSGVKVFSASAANAVPVAEYVLSQILLANVGFYQAANYYSNDNYAKAREFFHNMPGNYDEVVGLVGCGKIATDVIGYLKPFNLKVVVYDPYLSDERAASLGVKKVSLEELFKTAITVSNHLPNNDETKGMLGYELFSTMRPNATFINTGRGAQVVEADLVKALKEEPARTALLDVTDPEPVPKGSEFFKLPNVVLTPHMAGSWGNELRRMGAYMVEDCLALLEGKPLKHEVTLEMLEHMA